MKENVLAVQMKARPNPACFPILLFLRKIFRLSFLFLLIFSADVVKAQPASATWPLTSTTTVNATVSGALTAGAEVFGPVFPSPAYNSRTINGNGTVSSQTVTVNPGPAATNSTTAHANGGYVQFSVTPQTDYSFTVNTVSLYMGSGNANSNGTSIEYSLNSSFTSPVVLGAPNGATSFPTTNVLYPFSFSPSGLEVVSGQTLYLRIYAWNGNGSALRYLLLYNLVISGTTTSTRPTVTTTAVTNITSTSASTGGNVLTDGGNTVTERGVVYGTAANPTIANTKVVNASGGTGSFTSSLTGLAPGTTYHVRAYATSSAGTGYGTDVAFSTADELVTTPKQMEYLKRALVAVRSGASSVYVGWRLLGTDPAGISFNVYRNGVKLNASPITNSTNYVDNTTTNGMYTVTPIINGTEGAATEPVSIWAQTYLKIPIQVPAGGTTPDGVAYTYSANDASVGDVDGDGTYEIILKWDPSNSKDNSQSGYTGNVYIDCYKMNGTRLWRIDLGRNIRAGAHYTQFMVYDLDGDGKAEMACKTADATVDGAGVTIGNAAADYRNSSGYVLSGPEFLTVFNGLTGAAMATTNYLPARGTVSSWGDSYGNRVDRFIAVVAYLDGARPSLVFGRGYYTRLVRVAWDWRNGQLTHRWTFDSNDPGNGAYAGQGNHQMTVGDVDGDGKDEVINGNSVINDNGKGLWANGLGHGDALHMSDMDPDRPGQEIWQPNEEPASYGIYGSVLKDAKTGVPLWGVSGGGADVGRGMAADIDPAHKGYEVWSSVGNLYNIKGTQISTSKPSINFGLWWDGDLSRELFDASYNSTTGVSTVRVDKWIPANNGVTRLLTPSLEANGFGQTNNTTKANPCLTADLLGDWREEILLRSMDNNYLLLYTTTTSTTNRIYTLMHDPQYRVAVAWQNSAYNQPPHPGFYLGNDMTAPPVPNIVVEDSIPPAVIGITRKTPATDTTSETSVVFRVNFSETVNGVDAADFSVALTGSATGTVGSVLGSAGGYDVMVNGIFGEGTLRLDLNASGTNIVDTAGNPISGGFTTGEMYTIVKRAQTITFPALGTKLLGDADFDPGATASSGLPVSYTSSNTSVATIVGGMIHIVGLGTTQITASQPGDNKYFAATPVMQTLTVKQGFFQDYDRDTYGNPNAVITDTVSPGAGWITVGGDCNDKNSDVHPGAPELPDNMDNDCDGQVDEGLSLNTYYQDYDRDGYGNDGAMIQASIAPVGYVTVGGDCNDKNSSVYPGASEIGDNLDNNCNGQVDEGLGLTTFYQDYDRDGYGNSNATIQASKSPGAGWITVGGDCNDKKNAIHPGATEVLNGIDDNCNGAIDEGLSGVSVTNEVVEEAMTTARIKVSALPNPSSHRFILTIQSKSNKPVQVKVTNILGSVVEQRLNVAPNATFQMGQSYKAGVYFVEVRQGTEREIVKLIRE